MADERNEDVSAGTDVAIIDTSEIDRIDDAAILGVITSGDREAFVYEFVQGGKTIRGLTTSGIDEAANFRGNIEVCKPEIEDKDNSIFVLVEARDLVNRINRWGCFEQPKRAGGRVDPYAAVKAVSKAQRNALKKLLPQKWQLQAVAFLCGDGPQPTVDMAVADPQPVGADQGATFATLKGLMPALSARGVTQDAIAQAFRDNFGVESRADLTEANWAELAVKVRYARDEAGGLDALVGWLGGGIETDTPEPAAGTPAPEPTTTEETDDDLNF